MTKFNYTNFISLVIKFLTNIRLTHNCQFLKLPLMALRNYFIKSALSPLSLWVLVLITSSCDWDNKNLPISGPYQLLAIDRPICQGMLVQFQLIDLKSGKAIDFSDFTFEPIPPVLGEIDIYGLYKAPAIISRYTTVQIKVTWKLNPEIGSSYILNLAPLSELNLIAKIPHQVQMASNRFFDLSDSNDFLFGSPHIGRGPAYNISSAAKVVEKNGQIKWEYYYGPGQMESGFFYNGNSLVSGWVFGRDGISSVRLSKIYDPYGNDLKKEVQEIMNFRDYYVGPSGDFYVSNSSHRPYQSNPTSIVKLSREFKIMSSYTINYPIQSFLVNQDDAIVGFYEDDLKEESGVVMVDKQGQEIWHIPLAYYSPNQARLVAINDQKYGLVKADCKVIPCAMEMIYYEIGVNGELINPGQTIVSSSPWNTNSPNDDQDNFQITSFFNYIADVIIWEEEVLVVFYTRTNNYLGIMIKGTQGSSLEYWWDMYLEEKVQNSLRHVKFIKTENGLEWKTFCGKAICTFQLEKNLAFNSCF